MIHSYPVLSALRRSDEKAVGQEHKLIKKVKSRWIQVKEMMQDNRSSELKESKRFAGKQRRGKSIRALLKQGRYGASCWIPWNAR
ncbi:hypothetical protein Tco_0759020 [Tanacetum coccineum]